ncbi:MAG TPA: NAD(P)-binding domain-containing protein, partial [Bacteroidales bacterium]|nr:NAD(P)-binding domain-containing protein [Bacteroidales bacterium]
MKIGIIGVGNIGKAIVSGLAKSDFVPEENIAISDIEKSNLELIKGSFPKIQSSTENKTAAQADIVIVAVKPWLVGEVLTEIAPLLETSRPILVVVAAGVSFEQIYGKLPGSLSNLPCYRFIPNTAIALRESMSLLSAANTTPEQDKLMMGMLRKLGKAVLIHPDMMAAGTSLTSCGTGFALQFIKANVQVA